MNNTLTKEQVEVLFDYCKNNGIHYYDVQLETIDHLSNCIETVRAENPEWSFENAFNNVVKNFDLSTFQRLNASKKISIGSNNLTPKESKIIYTSIGISIILCLLIDWLMPQWLQPTPQHLYLIEIVLQHVFLFISSYYLCIILFYKYKNKHNVSGLYFNYGIILCLLSMIQPSLYYYYFEELIFTTSNLRSTLRIFFQGSILISLLHYFFYRRIITAKHKYPSAFAK